MIGHCKVWLLAAVVGLALQGCTGSSSTGTSSRLDNPSSLASGSSESGAQTAWTPEPARYGIGHTDNMQVKMADGTLLAADVYFPTDPATGKAAKGPFPVILVQTPYGKEATVLGAPSQILVDYQPYLIKRGYIEVISDLRGTGSSQGSFGLFDPVQGQDGATLARWVATLPHSNGKVGLYGNSFMGIAQYFTAADVGPDSPVKAMFPIDAANDLYRDIVFAGRLPDLVLDTGLVGVFGALNVLSPVFDQVEGLNPGALTALVDHLPGLYNFNIKIAANVLTGGSDNYDDAYWQARAPRNVLAKVVANGIPAYLVDGFYDVYQRGAPLDYSGLQNAYAGRPVDQPMLATQKVTPRYQLLMGPWTHTTFGAGIDLNAITLQWFDHWLKGEATGIMQTDTPLHVGDVRSSGFYDATRYPFAEATPTTYYFGSGGALTTTPPTAGTGADPLLWTGLSNPCTRSTDQWLLGVTTMLFQSINLPDPCTGNEPLSAVGPGQVTYTTAPFQHDTILAGPIDVTVYATATSADVELIATLDDIAPDGKAQSITSGALLGSARALDPALTWTAPDGKPLLPYHPYTQAAARSVTPGKLTRYDIEVFPTVATLARGHSLRVRITTADVPHIVPNLVELPNLIGGVYQIQHNAAGPSFAELPLTPAGAFSKPKFLRFL